MSAIKLFESKKIRSVWNEEEQKWYFSVVDVVEILTDSIKPRDYWYRLKKGKKNKALTCRQFVDN
jgi:DNA-damage-inducible protein D